jgi:small-conductance mechanosensitive channel
VIFDYFGVYLKKNGLSFNGFKNTQNLDKNRKENWKFEYFVIKTIAFLLSKYGKILFLSHKKLSSSKWSAHFECRNFITLNNSESQQQFQRHLKLSELSILSIGLMRLIINSSVLLSFWYLYIWASRRLMKISVIRSFSHLTRGNKIKIATFWRSSSLC